MINPRGMTLRQWADAMVLTVPDSWNVGKLMSDEDWQNWGVQLVRAPNATKSNPPSPYSFDNWRDWAERLAQYELI